MGMTTPPYQGRESFGAVFASIAKLAGLAKQTNHEDFEGDGSTVAFPLTRGWEPTRVYLNGNLQRDGAGNDYTVSRDVKVWTVTFSTAPSLTDWVRIETELSQ